MNIDGTQLRHDLLSSASGAQSAAGSSATGAVPRIARVGQDQGESETFANEIARRAEAYLDENGQPKDTSALSAGLADAMDWLRENYGDDLATAAEGMVMGATAGGISEENLGNGLTSVLKMVDRNFGYAAGDAAIARFNGSLNNAINDFFDNGQNERFLAVESGSATSQSSTMGDLTDRVLAGSATSSTDAPSGMSQLLDALRADLDETLQRTQERQAAGTDSASTDARTARALDGYAAASGLSSAGPSLISMNI